MIQLKKFILLLILVFSSYSISYSQSNAPSFSTGWIEQTYNDSVLVPLELIRVANVKLLDCKYEREKNGVLRDIVEVDSTIINALHVNLAACELDNVQTIKAIKKQRNLFGATSGALLVLLVLSLL